jgi:hypothetical protein
MTDLRSDAGGEWVPLSAAGLVAFIDIGYISLINVEISSDRARVAFVAVALAVAAASLLVTVAIRAVRIRLALASFAATMLVLMAILASMSIGVLLAAPALLAVATCGRLVGSGPARTTVAISAVGGVAGIAVLAIGFMST